MRLLTGSFVLALVTAALPVDAQVISTSFGAGDSFVENTAFFISQEQSIAQSFTYHGGSGFELFELRLALGSSVEPYTVNFLSGVDMNAAQLLESWTLPTFMGDGVFGRGIATFTSVGGVSFVTGTTYWISLTNTGSIFTEPRSSLNRGAWLHNDQGIEGTTRRWPGGAWFNDDGPTAAYDVSARATAVPEPATWALLFAAITGMTISFRRRAQLRVLPQ